MEKFKTFSDYALESGSSVERLDTSFLSDFRKCMQDSVRQSDENNMKAISSASSIIIR